jgi:hypothetical protein
VAVPVLLVSALVAYALVVAPYVPKRSKRRGVVLFDCLVGMLAELVILVLTSVGYGAIAALLQGAPPVAVASAAMLTMLYAFAAFLTQVLAVGNAAGLLGWLILEKALPRLARG